MMNGGMAAKQAEPQDGRLTEQVNRQINQVLKLAHVIREKVDGLGNHLIGGLRVEPTGGNDRDRPNGALNGYLADLEDIMAVEHKIVDRLTQLENAL